MSETTYKLGARAASQSGWAFWPVTHDWAVLAQGCLIIRERGHAADYLTYRTERGAQGVLGDVLRTFPHAKVVTRGETFPPVPPVQDRRVGLDA